MSKDPLSRVDEIAGGAHATTALRAGIAEFSMVQARHFTGLNDPAWVDRAIESPDWARQELQICALARSACAQKMMEYLTPWCVVLVQKEIENDEGKLAQIKLSMAREWDATKEIGSVEAALTVNRARGIAPHQNNGLDPRYKYPDIKVDKDYSRGMHR